PQGGADRGRRHGDRIAARAFAARPVRARQRPGAEYLVLYRHPHHGQGAGDRERAAVLSRRRCSAGAGRISLGRADRNRPAQRPPAIRHHLVRLGGGAGRRLYPVRDPPSQGTPVTNDPYRALESRFRRLGLLQEASGFLSWDTDTMMPEGAAASRAEQQAALDVVCHGLLTGPDLPDLFAAADAEPGLDPWQSANLREMRRAWLHATSVPADLVEASSRACSACEMAWRKARPANDYASIRPLLQTVLDLTRRIGEAKAATLGVSPYEALLDQFEPGGRVADIDPLFARLSEILPGLIEDALAFQGKRPA